MKFLNNESKSINLIQSIIYKTKSDSLVWNCLSENCTIKENKYLKTIYDAFNGKYIDEFQLIESESFYAKHASGYFYLFKLFKDSLEDCSDYEFYKKFDSKNSYYQLAIQTNSDAEIILVNDLDQFQKELFTLFNILIRKHLEIDNFIDSFINDN